MSNSWKQRAAFPQFIHAPAAVRRILHLTVIVWNKGFVSRRVVAPGLCLEESCGELSGAAAQHNEPLSGFHTELLWFDSRGPSAKIALQVRLFLSWCAARVCACVCVDNSYCEGTRNNESATSAHTAFYRAVLCNTILYTLQAAAVRLLSRPPIPL